LIKPVNPSCGDLLLTYISMREVRTWKHEWQTNRTSSSAGGPCNTAERVHTTSGWQCDVLWICTLSAKIKHLLNPLYLQFSSSFLPPNPWQRIDLMQNTYTAAQDDATATTWRFLFVNSALAAILSMV
jgi:hypothetical protein